MVTSILNTIKQMLGLPVSDTAFDQDVIVNINSAFMILNQLGVGPEEVFFIEDSSKTWQDFTEEPSMYQAIKTYIYLKVRLSFDPPGTSFLIDAMEKQVSELEWRLNIQLPIPDPEIEP